MESGLKHAALWHRHDKGLLMQSSMCPIVARFRKNCPPSAKALRRLPLEIPHTSEAPMVTATVTVLNGVVSEFSRREVRDTQNSATLPPNLKPDITVVEGGELILSLEGKLGDLEDPSVLGQVCRCARSSRDLVDVRDCSVLVCGV